MRCALATHIESPMVRIPWRSVLWSLPFSIGLIPICVCSASADRPLNQHVFKASHNSYERAETYAQQLDDYMCWSLEFDLCWNNADGYTRVTHDRCCVVPWEIGEPLREHLDELSECETCDSKVTIIWLEFKEEHCGDDNDCYCPTNGDIQRSIEADIDATIGWDNVYTKSDFASDGHSWPSWQEMVEDEKHFVVFLQRLSLHGSEHLLRATTGIDNVTYPPPRWDTPAFTFHHEDGFVIPDEVKRDFWIVRPWPDAYCEQYEWTGEDALDESDGEWHDMVSDAPTLAPTNCISYDNRNLDPRIHPAQPTFVLRDGGGGLQYGSRGFPYVGVGSESTGLVGALRRMAEYGDMGDVMIEPGTYDLSGTIVFEGPARLTVAPGGSGDVVLK